MSESVERFTSRVESYAKYRPGYPAEILELLKTECGLTPDSIIADIGSGTGKSFEMFLTHGNVVFGVEPNASMRSVAERLFENEPRFHSIDGSAESTTLADASVDVIIAGQAFHWFDLSKARDEWVRILKPRGWAVLIWNQRELQTTPFLHDYEKLLLEFGTDYKEIRHEKAESGIKGFFAPGTFTFRSFPNRQVFDFDGLEGRVRSSSYTPEPDHPKFEPMMRRLRSIFDEHQTDGFVNFDYETRVFYGLLPKLRDMRSPAMVDERRRNQRQKVLLEARWASLSKRHEARVDDVSLGGCFVNTYGPVEVGELVELKIRRRSGEWLQLNGHVATYQHGVGFGLVFTDLNEEDKAELQELIATGG